MHLECSVRRSARLRGTWNCRQPAKGWAHGRPRSNRRCGCVRRGGHTSGCPCRGGGGYRRSPVGIAQFRADPGGYAQLVAWMESRGRIRGVGVEGTGSYGAGLARHLGEAGIGVVEVNRPNRQLRRRRGKDDHTDAEAAARAALSGEATAVPKSGDEPVEWIRMLTVVRRCAVKNHTQAANQIHSVAVTAPEPLKAQLRGLNLKAQIRVCASRFPDPAESPRSATPSMRNSPSPSPPDTQTLDTEIAGTSMSRSAGLAKLAPRPTRRS